ncbi:MAG: hypothetical protein J7J75_02955 [Euryarchaeota archaeon]|nr:hypothetical protein [Euryarchaeota archaeon]
MLLSFDISNDRSIDYAVYNERAEKIWPYKAPRDTPLRNLSREYYIKDLSRELRIG